jgi:hypothetical protein
MSNICDERLTLRDKQRAAIRAAVAHANALTQPVGFPDRRTVAECQPSSDRYDQMQSPRSIRAKLAGTKSAAPH